jgi:adenosine deaminase
MDLPGTGKLRELVQVGENEELSFENFLSKFQTLRLFYRSPEVIERITRETIEDAALDNVRYMELRFTPLALSKAESFPLAEVIDWVTDSARTASEEFKIKTRLIISVNRHEGPELAAEIAKLASDRIDKGIVGLDLAGNEANFSSMGFLGVFKEARQAGLHITIHAGEWGPASNVQDAILYLQAERIGHGVRVLEDPSTVALARERSIPFEVCVTSNYQSGVIPSLTVHPLPRMISLGLNVTINTDDPSISQITLSDEYRLVCEDLGLSLRSLRERSLAAARAAFLPESERLELAKLVQEELPAIL